MALDEMTLLNAQHTIVDIFIEPYDWWTIEAHEGTEGQISVMWGRNWASIGFVDGILARSKQSLFKSLFVPERYL